MNKQYQKTALDTSAMAVPEQVSVAMGEIAEDMREGLLALAVGAGLHEPPRLWWRHRTHEKVASCQHRGSTRTSCVSGRSGSSLRPASRSQVCR